MKLKINKQLSARIWINNELVIDSNSAIFTGSDGKDLYFMAKRPEDGTEIKFHLIKGADFEEIGPAKETKKKKEKDSVSNPISEREESAIDNPQA